MTTTLPTGFTAVADALPDHDRPVLAIRMGGYASSRFEVLTARHRPDHRPRNPWCVLSGSTVDDSGSDVLGWREAPDWLQG